MASYDTLVYSDSNDGWTKPYSLPWPSSSSEDKGNISYYTNISNYGSSPIDASWFQHSWWNAPRFWTKIYHNTTGIDMVFTAITFLCCSAHSNGHNYLASGGGTLNPCYGLGFTFQARYYVSSNTDSYTESYDTYSVMDVTESTYDGPSGQFCGNICRVDGKGAPAIGETSTNETPYFGGCGRGFYVGDDQLLNYVNTRKFGPNTVQLHFEDPITVPNGEYMFLIVDVIDWHGGGNTNQTMVLLADAPYFTATPSVPCDPYVWRMEDLGNGDREWQKTRYCFQWTGSEWKKLDAT